MKVTVRGAGGSGCFPWLQVLRSGQTRLQTRSKTLRGCLDEAAEKAVVVAVAVAVAVPVAKVVAAGRKGRLLVRLLGDSILAAGDGDCSLEDWSRWWADRRCCCCCYFCYRSCLIPSAREPYPP